MTTTVGIPQSLLYFHYYPAWRTFFQQLGTKVVESDDSNQSIIDRGVKLSVDEACFPVKACHGHIVNLRNKVDYIFLPRIISVAKDEYVCPKLMGLADMIKNNISNLPELLTPIINHNQGWLDLLESNLRLGAEFADSKFQIMKAHWQAKKALRQYQQNLIKEPKQNKLTIALLGHAYILNDEYLSLGLKEKLEELGVEVITPQNLTEEQIDKGANELSKSLFWTFNREIIGAAYYLFERQEVDGFIQLAAFGCGPDSLIGELIERKAKRRSDIHFMSLNLDEHTGEAGLETRLEAFVDMIRWEAKGA